MLSLERRGQLPEELQLSLKKQVLPHLLEEVCRRTPDQIALSTPNKSYSFQQLDEQSDQIARHLVSHGIEIGSRVAVFSEPSWESIIALFGVLKAGASYLALDPVSQKSQISSILEKAQPSLLIAGDQKVPGYLSDELKVLNINEILSGELLEAIELTINPQDTALIVFKSGVKGIELTHQGVMNLVFWYRSAHGFGSQDTAPLMARPRCETAMTEILIYLCNGVTVKIPPCNLVQSPQDLKQWICDERISLISLPTSTAEELIDEQWPKEGPLRILFTRGDRLKKPPPSSLPFHVINSYGLAECGGVSAEYLVKHDEESLIIPIGHTISNVKGYVFDTGFQEVAHGESGQLCLGGLGLAKGYLDEEMNHEKFVIHTRIGKRPERLFLTGDLVRKRNDGKLELLGKIDQQESIGDSQVGLTAVESIINSHVGILHAVVQPVKINDETVLVAYWVGKENASVSEGNLKRSLKRRLPAHMVPRHLIQLTQFPIGGDGKISIEQLPIPHDHESMNDAEDLPTNAIEKQLAHLWESVLEISPIGIHKSFFDLGGNSLTAARLLLKINQHFGKGFSSTTFFEHDTIAKMRKLIVEPDAQPTQKAVVAIRKEGRQPPLICLHGFVGGSYFYYALSRHLHEDIPLYAIDATDTEGSIEEIALRTVKKIKQISPKGPYSLLGQGVGAYLTYEVARLLNREVSFVGILDTFAPNYPKYHSFLKRLQIQTNYFFQLNGHEKKEYMIQKMENLEHKTSQVFGLSKKENPTENIISDNLKWTQKKVMASYSPKPCDLELTIFSAQEKKNDLEYDPSLGWKEMTQKLKIEKIVGSHATLLEKPNIKAFAEKLNHLLIQQK
ncbi:MAG: Linear gramicidin synthase subunit D [Chlamydiae bacterium]|nr:Linear gramicidin synthase subunit D [Chlamydiota bacterium]